MATFNVEMRQRVSGSFSDIIYPKAHWGNIDGKPSTFAPTAHTHDIDDINATGTPSASNFLRGDGSWATPEGGGSGGLNVIADITVGTNTTLVDITNLDITSGKKIEFEMYIKSGSANLVYMGINGMYGAGGGGVYRFVREVNSTSSTVTNSTLNTGFPMSVGYAQHTYVRGQLWLGNDNKVMVRLTEAIQNNLVQRIDSVYYLDTSLVDNKITSIQIRRMTTTAQPDILIGSTFKFWEVI